MTKMPMKEVLTSGGVYAAIGAVGGMIMWLYYVQQKSKKFKVTELLFNLLVGGFIGFITGTLLVGMIGEAVAFSVTGMSGILSMKLLEYLDKNGIDIFTSLIKQRLGNKKEDSIDGTKTSEKK